MSQGLKTASSTRSLQFLVRIALLLLVLNHLISPCIAFRGSIGRNSFGKGISSATKNQEKSKSYSGIGAAPRIPGVNNTRRGIGMSAWGIIFLVVTLILAGMGFYYFSICYPILCKKQRKYDMMQIENV